MRSKISEQATEAVKAINSDYTRHSQAAEAIAREWFDSDKVIGSMLERIGVS